jgi:hypothetical protein
MQSCAATNEDNSIDAAMAARKAVGAAAVYPYTNSIYKKKYLYDILFHVSLPVGHSRFDHYRSTIAAT